MKPEGGRSRFTLEELLEQLPPTRQTRQNGKSNVQDAKKVSGPQPDTHPTDPTDLQVSGSVGLLSGSQPDTFSPSRTAKTLNCRVCRVGGGVSEPQRDPDPSGCPPHWQVVPVLPPKGSRVRMTDEQGFGRMYRVKVGGMWWLITFLPPYDGRVSLTDEHHRVRVFRSLVEAGTYLATLCGTEVAPRHWEEVRG